MSSERRLKELGLWHLRDNHEELLKALDKQIEQSKKESDERSRKWTEEHPKKEQGSAH